MAESSALAYLRQHRAHDVRGLLARWRKAVKGTGFSVKTLGKKDGHPLVQVSNRVKAATPGFYASAGIHGDEPAPPWALLDWFEQGGFKKLGECPILLFPCLNPLGILENLRVDGQGRDLNRSFDQPDISPIQEVRQAVEGRTFQLALCLHEDYDARGAYLYNLNCHGDTKVAHQLMARAVSKRLPLDNQTQIEGRPSDRGVITPTFKHVGKLSGLPEGPFLFINGHTERSLTFETPSEFCLVDRIKTHRRFLDAACRWMVQSKKRSK